ncbi:MAG: hypothetical protein JWP10_91 [Nocardioidaceae bacterium]|nr:hypothetical protein [Nocardioidaceae bacterium]
MSNARGQKPATLKAFAIFAAIIVIGLGGWFVVKSATDGDDPDPIDSTELAAFCSTMQEIQTLSASTPDAPPTEGSAADPAQLLADARAHLKQVTNAYARLLAHAPAAIKADAQKLNDFVAKTNAYSASKGTGTAPDPADYAKAGDRVAEFTAKNCE